MEVRTQIQANLQVRQEKQTPKSLEGQTHGNQRQIPQKTICLICIILYFYPAYNISLLNQLPKSPLQYLRMQL